MRYDVAVIGLGGMGSAILAHCASRGSAIGLEQFERGHQLGSSTGKTRLIRKAYFEAPAYVPLLLRAYGLWRDLEEQSGSDLLQITGLLMVGAEGSEVIEGSRRAAQAEIEASEHAAERVTSFAIKNRFQDYSENIEELREND